MILVYFHFKTIQTINADKVVLGTREGEHEKLGDLQTIMQNWLAFDW